MKKALAMLLAATLVLSCAVFPTTAFAVENDEFYDDFSHGETNGCIVDLKVSGFDGKYSSTSVSYSQNANGELVFTTGKHTKDVKISTQVLRYQATSDVVTVDNILLMPVNG